MVQIITNIRKLYREIKVGNPLTQLRPSPLQGDHQDITCCLDYMRHFVNRAKHVRFEGFVYATDLSSVFETVALVRSMLFLVHGGEKLFTASVEHSIPRLPKIERYYVSRLFYAAKNAASALSDQDTHLLQVRRSLTLEYSTNIDWNRRVPASGLTLDLLPSARWIDCTNLIYDELDNITDCFRHWIKNHSNERDFRRLAIDERNQTITTDELIKAARRDLFPTNDPSTRTRNSRFILYESGMDEPGRILDFLWYTRHLAKRVIDVRDPAAYASAHELLAIVGASIEVMRSLGWKNEPQYAKSLKTFDILIRLFTEHIKAIDNPILGEDEFWEVLDGIEKSRPGLIFFDIDFSQVSISGSKPSRLGFDKLNAWKLERNFVSELNAMVEDIAKESGGMIAIEIPALLAEGWKTIIITYRLDLFSPPSLHLTTSPPPLPFLFTCADYEGANLA